MGIWHRVGDVTLAQRKGGCRVQRIPGKFLRKETNWAGPPRISEPLPGGKGRESSLPNEKSTRQVTEVGEKGEGPCWWWDICRND